MGKIKHTDGHILPPHWLHTLTEGPRTALEFLRAATIHGPRMIFDAAPDPHKGGVVTVPGLLMHDMTMLGLRQVLRHDGYHARGTAIGINLGKREEVDLIHQSVEAAVEAHGGEKVALIGHSIGGAQSLLFAYRHPDLINRVITLGSPYGSALGQGGALKGLHSFHDFLIKGQEELKAELAEYIKAGPPKASVLALYSDEDGVVAPRAAQHPWHGKGAHANVRVEGSHCGMGWNTENLPLILSHLEQGAERKSRQIKVQPSAEIA